MAKVKYSRHSPGKFGLAIDWETSGSDFSGDSSVSFQGIAFGAVIFNTETLEPVETLYREIQFEADLYQWAEEAEKIHGLSRQHLAEHGVTREAALTDLLELILKWIGAESKVMFLGHNVDFDIDFTLQLCRAFNIPLDVHHVKLETSGSAYLLAGIYRSDDVFELFAGKTRAGSHNALDDALMALETARNMRAIYQSTMELT